MSERKIWVVWGGIFTDFTFEVLEAGTEELHGPYHDEATALRVWRDETRRKVDIATHRLFVLIATPGTPTTA
ncbi:hypothetical protein EJV46_05555 [Roseococcus sp. SYP-B2431]|uniref:DUF4170 domain-containing protein n=1 Tax=Roseococcus sp. SYP-B2431 TaxID=2496640 RepID=UPI001038E543|nr:hypothetical protein [Roseococcus sp. SYP-B2431]TCI00120.1 hypothetical protein EJV46_05555 [Roseococcus sp. SYP-B2431]